MKIKAELIQASNNLATSIPIYTFLLTYPVNNWLLDFLGLSRFESVAKHLTTRYYITGTSIRVMMNQARAEANRSVHCALTDEMNKVVAFTQDIFWATNPNNYGAAKRITSAQVKQAIDLFGTRLQDVLKQYKPGEIHAPSGLNHEHVYDATEQGWSKRFPQ
jgi:hypothetical protein